MEPSGTTEEKDSPTDLTTLVAMFQQQGAAIGEMVARLESAFGQVNARLGQFRTLYRHNNSAVFKYIFEKQTIEIIPPASGTRLVDVLFITKDSHFHNMYGF